jgi:competence protein ComEC
MRTRSLVVVVVVVLAGCVGAPVDDPGGPTESDDDPTATPSVGDGALEVHFINVEQSVATLVVAPSGETMLVDSGHYNDDGEHVVDYLERHGIDRIDHLVTSHGDADHIGGHAAVIEHLETEGDGVGAVYDPGIAASTQTYGDYIDAVERHDVTLYETRAGDDIDFEGVDVSVFGPPEEYLESEARNENSIVLKLTYGSTSFLLTGDAEDDQEAWLVSEYGDRLDATVMKAGHHGSRSSNGAGLLDAADPEAVVVSSAYDSRYGHPHQEVLDRFAERGLTTYWTATHGHTVFVSDGRRVSVRTQAAAPTDPQSLRDGDPVDPASTDPVRERAVIGGDDVDVDSPTPTATDGGTPTAGGAGELSLADVHADAEGDDRENLNDEYLVFENTGGETLDLSGWTVTDEVGKTYTFPEGTTLAPGERVTLHTGAGEDTATDLYWDAGSPVWNNAGDTVTVRTADGTVVVEEAYS